MTNYENLIKLSEHYNSVAEKHLKKGVVSDTGKNVFFEYYSFLSKKYLEKANSLSLEDAAKEIETNDWLNPLL